MSSTSVFNLSIEVIDRIGGTVENEEQIEVGEYADQECEEIMRCFQSRSRAATPLPSPAIYLEPTWSNSEPATCSLCPLPAKKMKLSGPRTPSPESPESPPPEHRGWPIVLQARAQTDVQVQNIYMNSPNVSIASSSECLTNSSTSDDSCDSSDNSDESNVADCDYDASDEAEFDDSDNFEVSEEDSD